MDDCKFAIAIALYSVVSHYNIWFLLVLKCVAGPVVHELTLFIYSQSQ